MLGNECVVHDEVDLGAHASLQHLVLASDPERLVVQMTLVDVEEGVLVLKDYHGRRDAVSILRVGNEDDTGPVLIEDVLIQQALVGLAQLVLKKAELVAVILGNLLHFDVDDIGLELRDQLRTLSVDLRVIVL